MPGSTRRTIAIFGSINADVTGFCDRLPRPGETVAGKRYSIALGGKGANQAAAVARLGNPAQMIGRVGNDSFGQMVVASLGALGVGQDHLLVTEGQSTGVALINVDARAENSIVVIGGANGAVDQAVIDHAAKTLHDAPILLTQLEVPLAATLAAAAKTHATGGLVMLDPAPAARGGLSSAELSAVDIVTPNETEAEALVGIKPDSRADMARASEILQSRGVATVVIKLGRRGVYFRGRDAEGFVPPFVVKAINSVGAGDCFNGGLAVALARGDDLPTAVRFAAACGALATTGRGGAEAAPTLAEVEALLDSQRN
jgi:ribokinase